MPITTLRDILNSAKEIIDKNPLALDYPVYTVCSSSGALSEDVSLFQSKVAKYDLYVSPLDEADLGKPYICISYDDRAEVIENLWGVGSDRQ